MPRLLQIFRFDVKNKKDLGSIPDLRPSGHKPDTALVVAVVPFAPMFAKCSSATSPLRSRRRPCRAFASLKRSCGVIEAVKQPRIHAQPADLSVPLAVGFKRGTF